ncbi:MAG: bifunctional 4-hydroxy-2-oxoglutarate aldolase/2-dehydro-3-deoxy-phosphogluconate aldolase [Planctomycetota bacterium]
MNPQETAERIESSGILAVVRIPEHNRLMKACRALAAGGVTGIEITMSVADPFEAIRALDEEFGDSILLGAGSVTDEHTARRSIDAGARYVVSPIFREPVISATLKAGAAAIAGAMSPTEAFAAQSAGANIVKIFPADIVGMPYFRSVLAPMPGLRLMPTGGVTLDNAGDWIRAGAVAVGIGSALLDKSTIESGDWGELEARAEKLSRAVASSKQRREVDK